MTRTGTFCALGNKLYQGNYTDCLFKFGLFEKFYIILGFDEKNGLKRSTKGIPHSKNYEMESFISTLLNPTQKKDFVHFESLRLNKEKQMSRKQITKIGLSDIFIKMQVSDDIITCSPLKLNGQFL